jgi:hypothetical protein
METSASCEARYAPLLYPTNHYNYLLVPNQIPALVDSFESLWEKTGLGGKAWPYQQLIFVDSGPGGFRSHRIVHASVAT